MRFRNKTFLLLLVATATAVLAGQAQATTYHQTKHFADGSTAVFTVSDGGIPVSGAGIDLGDLGPNAPASAQSFVFKSGQVTNKSASVLAAAGSTGTTTNGGSVKFTNYLGVKMFEYAMDITWDYSKYKVTSIYNQRAMNIYTFPGWSFQGTSEKSHSPAGGATFTAFAQGDYESCLVWICSSKSPWMQLTGNGNGVMTGFTWGGV